MSQLRHANAMRLQEFLRTRPYFVVCAVTAEKGVSGSGESILLLSFLLLVATIACTYQTRLAENSTGGI